MTVEKIDHKAEALRLVDDVDEGYLHEPLGIGMAQVHATLALVEAQERANELAERANELSRIGHLIAYASHRLDHRSAVGYDLPAVLISLLGKVDFEIREGLGLS